MTTSNRGTRRLRAWRAYWVAALVAGELIALATGHPEAPLSTHLRWAFRTDRWWGRAMSAIVAVWFLGHLWWGWPLGSRERNLAKLITRQVGK